MKAIRRLIDWTATACRQYADAVRPQDDPRWLRENLGRAEAHNFRLELELEQARSELASVAQELGSKGLGWKQRFLDVTQQLEKQRSCRCCRSRLIDEALLEDEGP